MLSRCGFLSWWDFEGNYEEEQGQALSAQRYSQIIECTRNMQTPLRLWQKNQKSVLGLL